MKTTSFGAMVLAVGGFSLSAGNALAQAREGWFHDGMMGGWGDNWFWGHAILGPFVMLFFWGGIIALFILGINWIRGNGRTEQPGAKETPLDILNARLARGEIDRKEYEETKKLISG